MVKPGRLSGVIKAAGLTLEELSAILVARYTRVQSYTIIVHEEEDLSVGGYWAEVVELPGCLTSGDTLDELEEDVRGAIETYIDAQKKLGKPVPEGPGLEGPLLRRWELAVS